MIFFSLLRILTSAAGPFIAFYKKIGTERKAAQTALVEDTGKLIHSSTLTHLGADPSHSSGTIKTLYDLAVRKIVQQPEFKKAHFTAWLNQSETQHHAIAVADAIVAGADAPSESRDALVSSYMEASGENVSISRHAVNQVCNVLAATLQAGVKDENLSALVQIGSAAAQKRFDKLDQYLIGQDLPEPGWSFKLAYEANEKWLQNAFSDKNKAKRCLGQALSPADETLPLTSISRKELAENLDELLAHLPFGGTIAVTGNEGNGKSWLVAQTWLSWAVKPLTIFITAEDVGDNIHNPRSLIARKLCDQTDRQGNGRHQEFWEKQLIAWQKPEDQQTLKILVVIDGLNQRPENSWSRALDLLSEELSHICGKLIITSRKRYFDGFIKPSLIVRYRELSVPEWTISERNKILADRGIQPSQLPMKVAESLCNPRLLSIALRLLHIDQLQAMEELSISLLLFEHLRSSHQDSYGQPVEIFTRELQDRAKEILERLNGKQIYDFKVFDALDAVKEGRFFVPLEGDLTRYTIQNEGLGLALGLAIIDELRAALRNNRDFNETLANLIEPISALDQTYDAIFAALTIACVTAGNSDEIGIAILIALAGVQNPDDQSFDAFAALVRARPKVFIKAAETLALQGGVAVNFDWIEAALHQSKKDPNIWNELALAIKNWLAHVSLNLDWRKESLIGKTNEEIVENAAQFQQEFEAAQNELTAEEDDIWRSLIKTEKPDVFVLGRLALTLLAGMKIEPFAESLVRWSFARRMNENYHAPIKQFRNLIRFNNCDWIATREALLRDCQQLDKDETSQVGKLALVSVLDATGHPEDARKAGELAQTIYGDRQGSGNWNRNQNYSQTDPCDPQNEQPENVAGTAERYAEIDVKQLCLLMSQNDHDRFFEGARPALARYFPDIAIERHRVLIEDMFQRTGLPLRQIVFELLKHNALITREHADQIVRRNCGEETDLIALESLGDEARVWRLFQLELAFPLLDAVAQLDALLQADLGINVSKNIVDLIKPLEIDLFETQLKLAIDANNSNAQFTVLLFAPFVNCSMSDFMHTLLPTLLCSDFAYVRIYALNMIVLSKDSKAIEVALNSTRNHSEILENETSERWNFSSILLEAALNGAIAWESRIAEMDIRHIATLALVNNEALEYFANAVEELFLHALNLDIKLDALDIQVTVHPINSIRSQSFSYDERKDQTESIDQVMRRASQDKDDFYNRRSALDEAFFAFRSKISEKNAGKLLEQFLLNDFASLAKIDISRLKRWSEMLLAHPTNIKLSAVCNMAFMLAKVISEVEPDMAVRVFEKFESIRPLLGISIEGDLEFGAMAVWSAADVPQINKLRYERLDRAVNNDELAREVWTALSECKYDLIKQYIDLRLNSTWPAAQARAILVAGLTGQNHHSNHVLDRFQNVPGLLGSAQRVASEYYQRHIWALHWYTMMRNATSPEDFWRATILFRVVVDGRIEALRQFLDKPSSTYLQYWPGARRGLSNRYSSLRSKWKKNLFAEDAPQSIFISVQNK